MPEREDPLLTDLRRFILSYGEHDRECSGASAQGPTVLDPALCGCGFIPRMEALLTQAASRLKDLDASYRN